jgi:uncharacterized membrane protein (DUF4010 family)
MFMRNLIILAIFSPSAAITAAGPLLAMAVVALIFVHRARANSDGIPAEIRLESPASLSRVLSCAGLFVLIKIVSTLGERYLGKFGFLAISVIRRVGQQCRHQPLPQIRRLTDKCSRVGG